MKRFIVFLFQTNLHKAGGAHDLMCDSSKTILSYDTYLQALRGVASRVEVGSHVDIFDQDKDTTAYCKAWHTPQDVETLHELLMRDFLVRMQDIDEALGVGEVVTIVPDNVSYRAGGALEFPACRLWSQRRRISRVRVDRGY